MQIATGVDLVDLTGFRRQLSDPASAFVHKTFSTTEIQYANAVPEPLRTARLGVRYAAREAFLKAWSALRTDRCPVLRTFPYHQATITHDPYGRPKLQLRGALAQSFEADGGGTIQVSLSHDGPMAIAYVTILRS